MVSTGAADRWNGVFFEAGKSRTVELEPRLQVNDVEAALVVLRSGGGIGSVLSYQVAEELAAGRLERLLRDFEAPPVPVQLVVPSARLLPGKTRAFLDHAVTALAGLAVLRPETA